LTVIDGTFGTEPPAAPVDSTSTFPVPPASLTAAQRALWLELQQHCGSWVQPSDALAVQGAVTLMDRLRQVHRGTGAPIADVIAVEVKLLRELRGYLGDLGLTPTHRRRLTGPNKPERPKTSKWAAIITGGKP
jgi:hypothetical protein